MESKTNIGEHIVNFLLNGEKELSDPVLIEWLNESDVHKKTFNRYRKIWDESEYYTDAGAAWEKIDGVNRKRARAGRRLRNLCYAVSGAAASIIVIFALSLTGQFGKDAEISVGMRVDYGSRSNITLPDGSTVKLNSGSEIAYSYDSKEKIRKVTFQGEGFFDVAKSDGPFVVRTVNGPEVKVLGTSFNLQAYANDRTIRTSLVEGNVELTYENEKLTMHAGDIAVFDRDTRKLKQTDGVLSHSYGWLENKLYMDDMSLTDVCRHLERWYGVDIHLQAGLGENIHYNGIIREETISDVLDALSRLSNMNYHVKGKNISITTK
ncbi:MAG: DUF4974 domain-containing protein [Dysgonamonadaceae bacterium]|nr:DUF4974 domain-containing protein [Dysgonamonadaceae bacterium]